MTVCGGQRREGRYGKWWNARHSENRIEQRAIFGAQAFNFSALLGDLGFESAHVAAGRNSPPEKAYF